jgi:hypothetical protein
MTSPVLRQSVLAAPLVPSPDHARTLLRRELLRPEYHSQNLLQRLWDWIGHQFQSGVDSASQASPLGAAGAVAIFLGLLVLIGWLATRTQRNPRNRPAPGPVLTSERLSAADLRARAEAALAASDPTAAIVDGFRALTVRAIEQALIDDQPGATAHEIAVRLGGVLVERRGEIDQASTLFDLVLYGDRPATVEQARAILDLDRQLATVVGAR